MSLDALQYAPGRVTGLGGLSWEVVDGGGRSRLRDLE
jgi:hypothetical protein